MYTHRTWMILSVSHAQIKFISMTDLYFTGTSSCADIHTFLTVTSFALVLWDIHSPDHLVIHTICQYIRLCLCQYEGKNRRPNILNAREKDHQSHAQHNTQQLCKILEQCKCQQRIQSVMYINRSELWRRPLHYFWPGTCTKIYYVF